MYKLLLRDFSVPAGTQLLKCKKLQVSSKALPDASYAVAPALSELAEGLEAPVQIAYLVILLGLLGFAVVSIGRQIGRAHV